MDTAEKRALMPTGVRATFDRGWRFVGAHMGWTTRLFVLAACTLATPGALAQHRSTPVDSIVLERTTCYGTCVPYRLALYGDGRVVFHSLDARDSTRVAHDRVDPRAVMQLWTLSRIADFTDLPDSIEGTEYCRVRMTDNPYATITIAANDSIKRVRDYLGCPWGPYGLRQLERAIDSVANSRRWVPDADREQRQNTPPQRRGGTTDPQPHEV
ncbi:MAG TPA: DUF6438 domain-containing protein, partial [Gemmatimonadaceae bacterium]|nr:DUF6438 domain-containing protein [Gemmatimonadaceae bacterium]